MESLSSEPILGYSMDSHIEELRKNNYVTVVTARSQKPPIASLVLEKAFCQSHEEYVWNQTARMKDIYNAMFAVWKNSHLCDFDASIELHTENAMSSAEFRPMDTKHPDQIQNYLMRVAEHKLSGEQNKRGMALDDMVDETPIFTSAEIGGVKIYADLIHPATDIWPEIAVHYDEDRLTSREVYHLYRKTAVNPVSEEVFEVLITKLQQESIRLTNEHEVADAGTEKS